MFAKKPAKHMVKLAVTVNLDALPGWLNSGESDIPLVPFSQWQDHRLFEYTLFRLPAEDAKDWYFHKNASEYSHSFNAIIDLRDYLDQGSETQAILADRSPDLELRLWRGQMSIGFCQQLILVAPLNELMTITSTGKTSQAKQSEPRNQALEVPIGFENQQASVYMSVYESVDAEVAGYSNQLVNFAMRPATEVVKI